MDLTLDLVRAKAARAIGILLWLHVPLVAGLALLRGMAPLVPTLSVLILAGLVEAATVRRPGAASGHVVLAFAYAAVVAILVGLMQGHAWQADMHMYFFAALAITAALCSWPAILAYVGFVAVHHLALNFLVTRLVFGGDPDLMRVILHAVILVAEGVSLGVLTFVLAQIFARSEAGLAVSRAARGEAETLLAQRLASQTAQGRFVTELIGRITAIAEGRFQDRIAPGVFPPEYDAVSTSLNALCVRLDQALTTVADASHGIQTAGADLGTASQSLTVSSRDQADTLDRAAQAFDTLSGSLTSTARLAVDADQVMAQNRLEVERGTALLTEVVAAMGLIEQSTGQIRQIVEVMDNIAFQTNLLALNAGVEAARAGDSGRGFAVVAMEVRALAQRAAESSRDIRGLIDQGQGNVALGTQKVSQTNAALQSLLSNASKAAEIVSSIALQVKQQSQNLGVVHADVAGLDQQAQRNAGLASRIAEAGANLQQYSRELALGMQDLNGQGRAGYDTPGVSWAA